MTYLDGVLCTLFMGSKRRRCSTLLYGLYRNAQDPEDGQENNLCCVPEVNIYLL